MDLDWMKYLAYGFAFLGAAFGYAAIVLGMNLSSTYFFLLLPAGLLALLSYIAFRRVNRAKVLRRLRSAWGKEPKALKDDQESIGDFFDNAPKADGHIDERTWQDLNMDTVFSKMNHTLTISGQQVLYRMLRNPIVDNEETLKKRDSLIRLFQEDKDFRERIQLILHDIGDRCGTNLSTLLWTSAALKPSKLMRLYHVLFGIALLSPLPLLFSRRWLFLILGIYFINTNLHYGEQRRIRGHFDSVRSLARLMRYGEKIIALNHPALREETRLLSEALSDVRGLRKAIAWVGVESPDAMFGSL